MRLAHFCSHKGTSNMTDSFKPKEFSLSISSLESIGFLMAFQMI